MDKNPKIANAEAGQTHLLGGDRLLVRLF